MKGTMLYAVYWANVSTARATLVKLLNCYVQKNIRKFSHERKFLSSPFESWEDIMYENLTYKTTYYFKLYQVNP